MSIVWTHQWHPDPDATGTEFTRAMVNGKGVTVLVSAEALQDYGREACMTKAEDKIDAAMQGGELPQRVTVGTADFR